MDERLLFGSLSDRVRLASDEVEMVMRAEVRELIARRIRDEVDLFPAAASVRADGSCSDVESVRTRLAYQPVAKGPAAFDGRCIPSDRVVPRSNMANMLPRHALSAGRLARLGATRGFTTGCYEGMLEAAVPETVQRFTGTTAPTGILSVAAGVRAASAARALMKGLSGRLSRRLLPGIDGSRRTSSRTVKLSIIPR